MVLRLVHAVVPVLLLPTFAFAQVWLRPDIKSLAANDLLPSDSQIPNKNDNAYYKLETLSKKVEGKSRSIMNTDLVDDLFAPFSKLSREARSKFLEFRREVEPLRRELVEISKYRCVIPKDNAFLTMNLVIYSDFVVPLIASDAIYLQDVDAGSERIRNMLVEQLRWSDQLLRCQGSLIVSVLAISLRGQTVRVFNDFVDAGKLDKADIQRFLIEANNITPASSNLVELVKIEYLYATLWSINSIYDAILQAKNLDKHQTVLFDLKETMAHVNKFYGQLVQTIESGNLNKGLGRQQAWWSKYLAQNRELKARLDRVLDIEVITQRKLNDAEVRQIQQVLREFPQAKNVVGRAVLALATTNLTNAVVTLQEDIDAITEILKKASG